MWSITLEKIFIATTDCEGEKRDYFSCRWNPPPPSRTPLYSIATTDLEGGIREYFHVDGNPLSQTPLYLD